MYTNILIHYSEIGLKGKNRPFFENALLQQVRAALGRTEGVKRIFGRLLVELQKADDAHLLVTTLQRVFGIASISPAVMVKAEVQAIGTVAGELLGSKPEAKSFRVLTKRSDKQFPLTSVQLNAQIGSQLVEQHGKIVDLVDADVSIWIEIVNGKAILYTEKVEGLRGLPVGVSGKVAVMLSGGIDSPVAAWLAMKRGCTPTYVHFHSHPQTSAASIEKVQQLVQQLVKFGSGGKLWLVPFLDIQKEIMLKTEKAYRVILYRRAMMRIVELIARKAGAKAIVTGENLAQVASQTIESMASVQDACGLPVLRPVLCYDKQEIVALAERIGTYPISIRPHEDCCTLFLPKHPVIKADVALARKEEGTLPIDALCRTAFQQMEVMRLGNSGRSQSPESEKTTD